jgi:hypothetical protein
LVAVRVFLSSLAEGANGVSNAVGVGPGNTRSGVSDAVFFSFVPKTNSSIALPNGLHFLVLMTALL